MDLETFHDYQKSIVVLTAKEKLQMLELFDYPHIQDKARAKILKRLQSEVKSFEPPKTEKKKSGLSNEEVFKLIMGR